MFEEAIRPVEIGNKVLPSVICPLLASNPKIKNSVQCEDCNLVFRSTRDLNIHLNFTGKIEDYAQQAESLKDPSTSSSSEFFSLGKYFCAECKIMFKSLKGKKQHIGKVHKTKYKHSRCPTCNKKFRNKYAVRFHVKQVHDKSTRARCPNCQKEFYNKYLITSHLAKCQV
ncbi:unnamed protein product [Blepharisma stoltei]|uniref:C2H2-type domain-containing protein n=1 Tax=Blepharisma stoltei TaxID=1481888 RepID=A0AAU9IZW2_9CILI|nr:unnamed protein product [Blepharisma stoltei]